MVIGVPKEIKTLENRVALTPGGAESLVRRGHTVLVERGAGLGSGLTDAEYERAGAALVSREEAWKAEMVVKVKEPLPEEYPFLREGLILFTYLHLAADRTLTEAMLKSGVTGIAYETVQLPDGSLPLLIPMSEVAGRMAPQVGAQFLEKPKGGRGVLLGGVPGVAPASVVILGGGTVGTNAAKIALGMGAQVTILDVNHRRLQYLDDIFGGRVVTLTATEANIKKSIGHADLLIGAVLVPGAKAPKLVTRDMLPLMKEGSVIVDVAVDQGGAWRPSAPPPTPSPPTWWTGWSTTGWPTCRGPSPGPPPSPSPTRPCPTCSSWRKRAWGPFLRTRLCSRASTPTGASSPTRGWPKPSASPILPLRKP
jgi:alanine dehydrogenase